MATRTIDLITTIQTAVSGEAPAFPSFIEDDFQILPNPIDLKSLESRWGWYLSDYKKRHGFVFEDITINGATTKKKVTRTVPLTECIKGMEDLTKDFKRTYEDFGITIDGNVHYFNILRGTCQLSDGNKVLTFLTDITPWCPTDISRGGLDKYLGLYGPKNVKRYNVISLDLTKVSNFYIFYTIVYTALHQQQSDEDILLKPETSRYGSTLFDYMEEDCLNKLLIEYDSEGLAILTDNPAPKDSIEKSKGDDFEPWKVTNTTI